MNKKTLKYVLIEHKKEVKNILEQIEILTIECHEKTNSDILFIFETLNININNFMVLDNEDKFLKLCNELNKINKNERNYFIDIIGSIEFIKIFKLMLEFDNVK